MSDAPVPSQSRKAERPAHLWKPGQSGNPGGLPKGIRELERKVLDCHGPKVLDALQALYDLGMDASESGRVRVAALDVFIKHVKGAPRPPKDEPEVQVEDEAQLLERVIESVVRRDPAMVREKMLVAWGEKNS